MFGCWTSRLEGRIEPLLCWSYTARDHARRFLQWMIFRAALSAIPASSMCRCVEWRLAVAVLNKWGYFAMNSCSAEVERHVASEWNLDAESRCVWNASSNVISPVDSATFTGCKHDFGVYGDEYFSPGIKDVFRESGSSGFLFFSVTKLQRVGNFLGDAVLA